MPEEITQKPKGDKHPIFNTTLSALLIIVLLLSVCATVYFIASPPGVEHFTEFYLLGPGGKADSYPKNMDMGEQRSVIVGVANHEHRFVDYDLIVVLENATGKDTQFREKFSLADNATWQKNVTIKPKLNGTDLKLDFQLYADGNLSAPYRDCYLYMNIDRPWNYTEPMA